MNLRKRRKKVGVLPEDLDPVADRVFSVPKEWTGERWISKNNSSMSDAYDRCNTKYNSDPRLKRQVGKCCGKFL